LLFDFFASRISWCVAREPGSKKGFIENFMFGSRTYSFSIIQSHREPLPCDLQRLDASVSFNARDARPLYISWIDSTPPRVNGCWLDCITDTVV
jgi:hypothetical protein